MCLLPVILFERIYESLDKYFVQEAIN